MNKMFLNDTEIADLTGYSNRKCQREWLNRNGVRYLVGADGVPKIMVEHLKQIMCVPEKTNARKRTEPDIDALRKHLGTY